MISPSKYWIPSESGRRLRVVRRSSTEMEAEYEVCSRSTMWCPRKPQPPITRTLPRAFLGGIAAIFTPIDCGLKGELSDEVDC